MRPVGGTYGNQPLCCWPECFDPAERDNVPLCEAHLRTAGLAWVADNVDVVRQVQSATEFEATLDRMRQESRDRQHDRAVVREAERADRERRAVVYYLDLGDRIKIGFTTNLPERVAALRLDQDVVMATEPGGRDVERRRHEQFADERYGRREDFAPSDRLLQHIWSLRPRPS